MSIEYDIWLVCNISDCVLYAFKAWSIPEFSQEGTHGVTLDHQELSGFLLPVQEDFHSFS